MPRFEIVPLHEARLKTASGRQRRILHEYAQYIQELGEGQAGRLLAEEGEKVMTIQRRLASAANLLGKNVVAKRSGDEVYFWVEPAPSEERPGRRRRRRAEEVEPGTDPLSGDQQD